MWRGPGGKSRRNDPPPGGWDAKVRRIKDEVKMLPQYLKEAGYATGIFGKWHLGYDRKNVPLARGFDTFTGFLGGAHPYWVSQKTRMLHDAEPFNDYEHATDLFADHAIEFIKAHRDEPFFCYVPFNAVHGPLRNATTNRDSARPDWLEYYAKLGVDQPRRDYNAVMSHADARVGDILETLERLGIANNTLVIYLSDNGGILDKYPSNNGPLRSGKGHVYEGGIRVPAVMRWPKVIPAGTRSDAIIENVDYPALMLDYAGATIPGSVQGRSFRSICETGQEPPDWKQATYYRYWMHMAHRDNPGEMAYRTKTHKLIYFYGCDYQGKAQTPPAWELYDLTNDPHELNNVYDDPDYREIRDRLKLELADMRQEIGDDGSHYPACEKVVQHFWDYDKADRQEAIQISHDFRRRRESMLNAKSRWSRGCNWLC